MMCGALDFLTHLLAFSLGAAALIGLMALYVFKQG